MLALAFQAATMHSAEAQPPAADQPTADVYAATITEALREAHAGHFPEAYSLFERAHALFPNARALRGIGACAFEIRDYARAWTALHAALEHTVQPLTLEQRADVQALIERTSVFLARLELVGLPPDGVVRVDGAEAILENGDVLLSAGRRLITIEVSGVRAFQQSVDAVGGARQRMFVRGDEAPSPNAEVGAGIRDRADSGDSQADALRMQTFRIRVTSPVPGMTLLRDAAAAFTGSGRTLESIEFDRLCTAPCEVDLERGNHRFVIEDSAGRLRSLRGPTLIESGGELAMEIVSRRRQRIRRYILALAGLIVATPLITLGVDNTHGRGDESCCYRAWPMAGVGFAFAAFGLSSLVLATTARDQPRVAFEPSRATPNP
jgi:hypothetical protein